jgi:thioredoxin 1
MLNRGCFFSFVSVLTVIGGLVGCRDSQKLAELSIQSTVPTESALLIESQALGIIQIEENQFEERVLDSETLVLLDFWAEWCLPCLELDPLMPEVSERFGDQLLIAKINIDDHPNLVAEYVPDAIYPCLILMRNGEILDRRYGTDPDMEPKEFLLQWVDSFLDSI